MPALWERLLWMLWKRKILMEQGLFKECMIMDEELKQKIIEHPCNKCGESIYQRFPHPIFECGKDGHSSIMIIDLLQVLNHLYSECPLAEGEKDG